MEQDWKPLVLRKNTTVQKTNPTSSVSATSANVRHLENDEEYKPPTITREIGLQISQARTRLHLTQDQLAKRCAIPVAIIKQYEQGQGLYSRANLEPICKILNIVISKPKTKPKQAAGG